MAIFSITNSSSAICNTDISIYINFINDIINYNTDGNNEHLDCKIYDAYGNIINLSSNVDLHEYTSVDPYGDTFVDPYGDTFVNSHENLMHSQEIEETCNIPMGYAEQPNDDDTNSHYSAYPEHREYIDPYGDVYVYNTPIGNTEQEYIDPYGDTSVYFHDTTIHDREIEGSYNTQIDETEREYIDPHGDVYSYENSMDNQEIEESYNTSMDNAEHGYTFFDPRWMH
jgi:hypothetical protein